MLHEAAKTMIGTTANIVAGVPFTSPVYDVVLLDVDAHDNANGQPTDKCFRLLTDVSVRCGGYEHWLRKGFQWNGADIPTFFQWVLGVDRHDPRVAFASCFHDDLCNQANAGLVDRVVADAMFISLLQPILFNGKELDGVGEWRAVAMYVGVRSYSLWRGARRWGQRQ